MSPSHPVVIASCNNETAPVNFGVLSHIKKDAIRYISTYIYLTNCPDVQRKGKTKVGDHCDGLLYGNPATRAEGTGSLRVDNVQPGPLPQRTLPVTCTGFATRDNHYSEMQM